MQLALLSCWAPVKSLAVTCVLADALYRKGSGKGLLYDYQEKGILQDIKPNDYKPNTLVLYTYQRWL